MNNFNTGIEEETSDKSPNLSDLEDSFSATTEEAEIPKRPKSGLYFLLDWNTFLEVGEEGKKDRVNLRFQPKAGDRTRFIPIKIP